jgi:NAD-dependent SIR2 family protein deacetylase
VFLTIGTSAVVYPAADLIPYAKQAGAKVIEINTEPTAASRIVDCALEGPAGEILPRLIDTA